MLDGQRRKEPFLRPWPVALLMFLMAIATAPGLTAGEFDADESISSSEGKSRAPWRGSAFSYRNSFSAYSLDPSADLTYDPYYVMTFSFRPSWWFSDHIYVRGNLDLMREITHSDITTYSGETLVGDLTLTAGYSRIYTIPIVGVDISADFVLTMPTSKSSQAHTMILGLGPGLRLSRRFDLLGGLSIGYSLRASPRLHRMTTAERESALIPGCIGSSGGCDSFLNTGLRNSQFRLQQIFNVSLGILPWLDASVSYGLIIDWLYGIDEDDPQVSLVTVEPQDRRFASLFEVQVSFSPLDALQVGLGYSTVNPQLAPDSTYYNPLFNRYSTIFVELQLSIEGLISQITND